MSNKSGSENRGVFEGTGSRWTGGQVSRDEMDEVSRDEMSAANQQAFYDLQNHFFGHTAWLSAEVREIMEMYLKDMANTLAAYDRDLNEQGQPSTDIGVMAANRIKIRFRWSDTIWTTRFRTSFTRRCGARGRCGCLNG